MWLDEIKLGHILISRSMNRVGGMYIQNLWKRLIPLYVVNSRSCPCKQVQLHGQVVHLFARGAGYRISTQVGCLAGLLQKRMCFSITQPFVQRSCRSCSHRLGLIFSMCGLNSMGQIATNDVNEQPSYNHNPTSPCCASCIASARKRSNILNDCFKWQPSFKGNLLIFFAIWNSRSPC